MIKKTVTTTFGDILFRPELPIFINRVSESFVLSQHDHDFVEISFVSEGSGFHYIGDRTITVSKGDLFFIPVGTSHVFRPSSTSGKNPIIIYNCIFRLEATDLLDSVFPVHFLLNTIREHPDCTGEHPYLQLKDNDQQFERLFVKLYDEFRQCPPHYSAVVYAAFIELLVTIVRGTAEASSIGRSPAGGMDRLITQLKQHPGEPMNTRQAADAVGLSERQFHRRFAAHTGQTFHEFSRHVRIDSCCRQLRETKLSVSEIAAAVGYRDMKHFNSLFKRHTGLTPREYRFGRKPGNGTGAE